MVVANDLLCPITLEYFSNPVIAEDGHTYERKAIEEWINNNGTSPITKQKLSAKNLRPNYIVKKIIENFESDVKDKHYKFKLNIDLRKTPGRRPLFQTIGKTLYEAEWMFDPTKVTTTQSLPNIVLLKIDGARAKKEAKFYVDLSRHPHIVRTYGLVEDMQLQEQNSIMLVQEYAAGGSLFEFLQDQPLVPPENGLIEIFLQIIDAMIFLTHNSVVHSDLACRNVLLFRYNEDEPQQIVVKLTDFGLSRHSQLYSVLQQNSSARQTAFSIIPIRYAAPEILQNNDASSERSTEKSDVYSMGVLIWEAYSKGKVPWSHIESDNEVRMQVINGQHLDQPINCSKKYWNIIRRTLQSSPFDRPTFNELKQLLSQQYYQEESVQRPIQDEIILIPCEFCEELFDVSVIISHTSTCTGSTMSMRSSSKIIQNSGPQRENHPLLVDISVPPNELSKQKSTKIETEINSQQPDDSCLQQFEDYVKQIGNATQNAQRQQEENEKIGQQKREQLERFESHMGYVQECMEVAKQEYEKSQERERKRGELLRQLQDYVKDMSDVTQRAKRHQVEDEKTTQRKRELLNQFENQAELAHECMIAAIEDHKIGQEQDQKRRNLLRKITKVSVLDENTLIPCEFCEELFDVSVIMSHTSTCTGSAMSMRSPLQHPSLVDTSARSGGLPIQKQLGHHTQKQSHKTKVKTPQQIQVNSQESGDSVIQQLEDYVNQVDDALQQARRQQEKDETTEQKKREQLEQFESHMGYIQECMNAAIQEHEKTQERGRKRGELLEKLENCFKQTMTTSEPDQARQLKKQMNQLKQQVDQLELDEQLVSSNRQQSTFTVKCISCNQWANVDATELRNENKCLKCKSQLLN